MSEERRGRGNHGTLKATVKTTVGYGLKAGQTRPQTPSGEVKPWQPPSKGTSPANRKEDA